MLGILSAQGLPGKFGKFIQSLVDNRIINGFFQGRKFIAMGTTNKGLPQGSCLSLILFNLYISGIVNCREEGVEIIGFADDITILCTGTNLKDRLRCIEVTVSNINIFLTSVVKTLAKNSIRKYSIYAPLA